MANALSEFSYAFMSAWVLIQGLHQYIIVFYNIELHTSLVSGHQTEIHSYCFPWTFQGSTAMSFSSKSTVEIIWPKSQHDFFQHITAAMKHFYWCGWELAYVIVS